MKLLPVIRRLAKPLLAAWAAAMLTMIATTPARSESDPERVLGGIALIDWSLANCQFKILNRYQLDILATIAATTSEDFDEHDVMTTRLKLSRAIDEKFGGDTGSACAMVENALLEAIDGLT